MMSLSQIDSIIFLAQFTLFDGAVDGGFCGIGLFLKISKDYYFKAHFAGGEGSNIKAELLGLWGLLFLVASLSLNSMMVASD